MSSTAKRPPAPRINLLPGGLLELTIFVVFCEFKKADPRKDEKDEEDGEKEGDDVEEVAGRLELVHLIVVIVFVVAVEEYDLRHKEATRGAALENIILYAIK